MLVYFFSESVRYKIATFDEDPDQIVFARNFASNFETILRVVSHPFHELVMYRIFASAEHRIPIQTSVKLQREKLRMQMFEKNIEKQEKKIQKKYKKLEKKLFENMVQKM